MKYAALVLASILIIGFYFWYKWNIIDYVKQEQPDDTEDFYR